MGVSAIAFGPLLPTLVVQPLAVVLSTAEWSILHILFYCSLALPLGFGYAFTLPLCFFGASTWCCHCRRTPQKVLLSGSIGNRFINQLWKYEYFFNWVWCSRGCSGTRSTILRAFFDCTTRELFSARVMSWRRVSTFMAFWPSFFSFWSGFISGFPHSADGMGSFLALDLLSIRADVADAWLLFGLGGPVFHRI